MFYGIKWEQTLEPHMILFYERLFIAKQIHFQLNAIKLVAFTFRNLNTNPTKL